MRAELRKNWGTMDSFRVTSDARKFFSPPLNGPLPETGSTPQHQEVAFLLQQIYGVTPHSHLRQEVASLPDGHWSSDSLRNPARDCVVVR